MKKLAVGIDIGGTNTVFGFIDRDGNNVASGSFKTQTFSDAREFVKELCEQIESTRENIDKDFELAGIGIGAPNGNFYKGRIEYAPN